MASTSSSSPRANRQPDQEGPPAVAAAPPRRAYRSQEPAWVRWLHQCGLPPAHIVEVLGLKTVTDAAVAQILAYRPGCYGVTREQDAAIRRLHATGATLAEIARATGLRPETVRDTLHRPETDRPPQGPPRRGGSGCWHRPPPILAQTANRVRKLADLGYKPARIAEVLDLEPAAVRDFLRRAGGRLRTRNSRSGWLVKARPPGEPIPRRRRPRLAPEPVDDGWGYRDTAAPDHRVELVPTTAPPPIAAPVLEPAALAELPRAEPTAPAAGIPPATTTAADWGHHFGAVLPRGSRHGRAVFDAARAAEIRELRAEGLTIAELVSMFGGSPATINRVLAGRTYTDPPSPAIETDDEKEPEPAAGPEPAEPPRPDQPPAVAPPPPAGPDPWARPAFHQRMRLLHAKLAYEDAEKMRAQHAAGMSRKELQVLWGLSKSTVAHILTRKTYTAPPVVELEEELPSVPIEPTASPACDPDPPPAPQSANEWNGPCNERGPWGGLGGHPKPLPLDSGELARAYEAGVTLDDLAARCGVSMPTIRTRLQAAGIPMRPKGRRPSRSSSEPPAAFPHRDDDPLPSADRV